MRRHSTSSSSGAAFSGKGQTLGGAPAPVDLGYEANNVANGLAATFANLAPQVKVLLGLLGVYLVFWYLG